MAYLCRINKMKQSMKKENKTLNLRELLGEGKDDATPITEEWLVSHGFRKQYEKNHLGELSKYEWESGFQRLIIWKNRSRFECGSLGNCPIKTLGDLYLSIALLKINFE